MIDFISLLGIVVLIVPITIHLSFYIYCLGWTISLQIQNYYILRSSNKIYICKYINKTKLLKY